MPASSQLWTRYGFIVLLLLLTAPMYWLAIRPQHNWGGDFSVYVSQARNLAEGNPFYASSYVVTPDSAKNHPAAYPPVPSMVLAPVYARQGLDYQSFKRVLAVFAWLSLALWYCVGVRLGLTGAISACAVTVFGVGSMLFPFLDTVGSDGLYLFFSAAALLALLVVEQEGWVERRPEVAAVLVAALLLLNVATRAAGLALVAAFGGREMLRVVQLRRIPRYTWMTAALVGVGLAVYQLFLYDSSRQYGNQFSLEPRLVLRNMVFYLRMAAPLWSPAPTPLRYALSGVVIACGLFAWLGRLRRGGVVEIYLFAFFGMISVYTVNNDFRYTVPVLPVLLFLAFDGLATVGRRMFSRAVVLPAAFSAVALLTSALNIRAIETGPIEEGVGKRSFQETVVFLKDLPLDTLILSWNPRVFAFYTQHPSALYPQQAAAFEQAIPSAPSVVLVKYAHVPDEENLSPYLLAHPGIPVEFSNTDFTVYRLR